MEKGPDRTSLRKFADTVKQPTDRNDYSDGDARRELESTRHSKEPHVVEPPREPVDMESNVPVSSVGIHHSATNPHVDILEHSATDALDEATNRRHAHVDRARSGGSTIVK
jgi:hypothetical protein